MPEAVLPFPSSFFCFLFFLSIFYWVCMAIPWQDGKKRSLSVIFLKKTNLFFSVESLRTSRSSIFTLQITNRFYKLRYLKAVEFDWAVTVKDVWLWKDLTSVIIRIMIPNIILVLVQAKVVVSCIKCHSLLSNIEVLRDIIAEITLRQGLTKLNQSLTKVSYFIRSFSQMLRSKIY